MPSSPSPAGWSFTDDDVRRLIEDIRSSKISVIEDIHLIEDIWAAAARVAPPTPVSGMPGSCRSAPFDRFARTVLACPTMSAFPASGS